MAEANFSATPRPAHALPYPMANPGYGKRSAPDQLPRTKNDFAHLPPCEAAIAAYIDRLPNGADISVKTLAKELPYGQCALRTALNYLTRAGHLRRGREHLADSGSQRWITRTWFTRTARDDDWWAAFTRGDVPQESPEPPPRPTRSRAYILLAALGRTTPAFSLSERDCAELAPLLTEWFARGATDDQVLQSLTAGLPIPVHSPAALLRKRLTTKLPPEPVRDTPRPPLRVLECAKCGAPGRPEALPGGACGPCRGEVAPRASIPLTSSAVHTHAAAARAAMVDRHERPRV
ncbi:hypothetical protein OG585_20350 [Streptomyces sp. NBC_01340]|uniref:hypothetical protein n=1 Tax=unclassified Streptomyces TaxID=2593676 RepID=UPI0022504B1C|nr:MULTISPECIES: hypothetical protein [unclassified Streptomyces]MCX4454997.1 hypothetical protein [Streptomyces sp. NBC_01719]MCX4494357.1 hypothetical protein [Streptomyces sp. NBC_01728]MCX4591122.1 hypothetical protein [Streptomyces sp. NBC_01549]WSI39403.1 hypothetical protein OG585_20350 [Streptomyces sp. NBC_01340]